MGFFRGVITGLAVAAGAAAWYMSRSGARVREQYRLEERLGELGDQLETRTREIQSTVNAQLAEMRARNGGAADASTNGHTVSDALDDATASAAEAAASTAAEADALTSRIRKATKDVAEGSPES
jgi:gas vesicle protein